MQSTCSCMQGVYVNIAACVQRPLQQCIHVCVRAHACTRNCICAAVRICTCSFTKASASLARALHRVVCVHHVHALRNSLRPDVAMHIDVIAKVYIAPCPHDRAPLNPLTARSPSNLLAPRPRTVKPASKSVKTVDPTDTPQNN